MRSGYNVRQAASIAGLPESTVRTLIREGLLENQDGLSFRDLRLLRQLKKLVAEGVPMTRARKAIAALRAQMAAERDISTAKLGVAGKDVVVQDNTGIYEPDTGQQMLPLEVVGSEPNQAPIVSLDERRPKETELSAEEWFDQGVELEEDEPFAAAQAYRNVLRLVPECADAWINLGRIYAEQQETIPAMECFQRAYEIDPSDSTAVYNLAVVAQDAGQDDEAVTLYRHALALDPELAEAHYNLATIFDRSGDARAAIRHINEYRKIVKKR